MVSSPHFRSSSNKVNSLNSLDQNCCWGLIWLHFQANLNSRLFYAVLTVFLRCLCHTELQVTFITIFSHWFLCLCILVILLFLLLWSSASGRLYSVFQEALNLVLLFMCTVEYEFHLAVFLPLEWPNFTTFFVRTSACMLGGKPVKEVSCFRLTFNLVSTAWCMLSHKYPWIKKQSAELSQPSDYWSIQLSKYFQFRSTFISF